MSRWKCTVSKERYKTCKGIRTFPISAEILKFRHHVWAFTEYFPSLEMSNFLHVFVWFRDVCMNNDVKGNHPNGIYCFIGRKLWFKSLGNIESAKVSKFTFTDCCSNINIWALMTIIGIMVKGGQTFKIGLMMWIFKSWNLWHG